ncbi:MAG: SpoIIE family protein phosphatase, partial [Bacteroidales bacterium]|nr:SpoIIE family protein phosphatase [Bacteroidales bacterium]
YSFNGDAFVIKEFEGDKVLLAVIDGTGNGLHAYEVATFVKNIFIENYRSDPVTIAKKCHRNIRKAFDISLVRSCVLGILLLKPRSLEYVGVGDTSIHVYGNPEKIILLNHKGIVGDIRFPDLTLQKFRCSRNLIIIMCSDGIKSRYSKEDLPLDRSAQHIANFIMKNYHHQYGDATVLVAKRKK